MVDSIIKIVNILATHSYDKVLVLAIIHVLRKVNSCEG